MAGRAQVSKSISNRPRRDHPVLLACYSSAGFGGPPGPIRSRLVDQGDIGFPLEKPERERPSLDGPGPRGAPGGPPPRPWRPGQDKDEKWEGWGAHNHEVRSQAKRKQHHLVER